MSLSRLAGGGASAAGRRPAEAAYAPRKGTQRIGFAASVDDEDGGGGGGGGGDGRPETGEGDGAGMDEVRPGVTRTSATRIGDSDR